VRGGIIAEPFLLRFDELASQPRSLDAILKEHLEPRMHTDAHGLGAGGGEEGAASSAPTSDALRAAPAATREDHLALLARWYYAKPRSGEIFFPASPDPARASWPYRRIIRACSRILSGKGAEEAEKT
jgi:hypothetical protein